MRSSTLLLLTFAIWITAKGRAKQYWALATTYNSASNGNVGAGSSSGHANELPALPSWKDILNSVGLT